MTKSQGNPFSPHVLSLTSVLYFSFFKIQILLNFVLFGGDMPQSVRMLTFLTLGENINRNVFTN